MKTETASMKHHFHFNQRMNIKFLFTLIVLVCLSCKNSNEYFREVTSNQTSSIFENDNYSLSFQSLEMKIDDEIFKSNNHFEISVTRDSIIQISSNDSKSIFKYNKESIFSDSVVFKCDSITFIFYENNEVRHLNEKDSGFYILYKNPI